MINGEPQRLTIDFFAPLTTTCQTFRQIRSFSYARSTLNMLYLRVTPTTALRWSYPDREKHVRHLRSEYSSFSTRTKQATLTDEKSCLQAPYNLCIGSGILVLVVVRSHHPSFHLELSSYFHLETPTIKVDILHRSNNKTSSFSAPVI